VEELKIPPKLTVLTAGEETIVSVVPPQVLVVEEEEAIEEAAEGEGEPTAAAGAPETEGSAQGEEGS
jgi:hypothetical protein